MNCPVAEVQPAGRLIGTTVLLGTQSDKRQNMWWGNRAIREQPSRSHFIPLYLSLLSFLSLSLASVSKQRWWKDSLCFVFTATFCAEAQKPFWLLLKPDPLYSVQGPLRLESGDYSCKLGGLARANPWKFIILANSKGASFSRGALACLLTCLPCKAHCTHTAVRGRGSPHHINLTVCVCVYTVCVCVWPAGSRNQPRQFVLQPWMGKLFIDIFCG